MLQSAQKQKLDAGMSVESITENITSNKLHLFILPIRVFFSSHFVIWFRKHRTKSMQPVTGIRDGNGVVIPLARGDGIWHFEQNEIPLFL
jgi:hypothetical protein